MPAGWYAVFLALRVVGVLYLVWRVWRNAAQRAEAPEPVGEQAEVAPAGDYPAYPAIEGPDPDSDAVVDELAGDFTDAPDRFLVRFG